MYGIIGCSECRRKRIIDLSDDVTSCPYCGQRVRTKQAAIYYKNEDQGMVRDALESMSDFQMPERKKVSPDTDPLSSLAYKVEHTSDVMSRITLIAEELTRIQGTFTVDDVEELVPGKGEKYVKAMLDTCIAYEVGYGKYKV